MVASSPSNRTIARAATEVSVPAMTQCPSDTALLHESKRTLVSFAAGTSTTMSATRGQHTVPAVSGSGYQPFVSQILLLLLLFSVACGEVHPYERGLLAKPKMQVDPNPESTKFEQHVYDYREGATGGYGGVGGGCGCN